MADTIRMGAGVPLVALPRADDLVGRIEELISDANAQGYGSIAYFLEMAQTEACIQLERKDDDRRVRDPAPIDVWLPER